MGNKEMRGQLSRERWEERRTHRRNQTISLDCLLLQGDEILLSATHSILVRLVDQFLEGLLETTWGCDACLGLRSRLDQCRRQIL